MQDNEKRFEEDIESHLINNEYRKLTMQGYDVSKGIYLDNMKNIMVKKHLINSIVG